MRISDWSSDVCSSDLITQAASRHFPPCQRTTGRLLCAPIAALPRGFEHLCDEVLHERPVPPRKAVRIDEASEADIIEELARAIWLSAKAAAAATKEMRDRISARPSIHHAAIQAPALRAFDGFRHFCVPPGSRAPRRCRT